MKQWMLKLAVCLIYICSCMPAYAALPEGDPWGGEAVSVASAGTTMLYAARKNINASDAGAEVFDFHDWTYTVEDNPEKMAVRALEAGASWYYTVYIERAGNYQIDVLGWSGWAAAEGTDGGGRFSLELGGTKLVDGSGDSPVVLPPYGDGTAVGGHKTMSQFTDEDKTSLGTVSLEAGVQVLKFTADQPASGRMNFVKIWLTGPDPVTAEGEPWGGEAVSVAASGTTMLYAARKNVNAADAGAEIFDFHGWIYTVEDNPEKMAVRALEAGASWYYTVNVEASGLYQIDVLGWGGYASLAGAQPGGRFSLEAGGTKLVDGKGDSPVILPAWGEGTAAGSNKTMTEFTDEDKTNLGAVYLAAGLQVLKFTADEPASGRMGFVKIWLTEIDCGIGLPAQMVSVSQPDFSESGSVSVELTFHGETARSVVMLAALKNAGVLEKIHVSQPVQLQQDTPVALSLSELDTALPSGSHYTFYVWDSLSLSPMTIPFYGQSMLGSVPAEFRAADSALNDAYDFITDPSGGFKGIYTTESQLEDATLIQHVKDAGVNAFLVYIFYPASMTETAYKEMIQNWRLAVGDAKLFTVVGYGSDGIYGNAQFGAYVSEAGADIQAPCPQSEQYWNLVYGQRAEWTLEAGADGCLVDMEMYAATRSAYPGCCYCDACWTEFCDYAFFGENQSIETAAERYAFLTANDLITSYKNFQANRRIQILSKMRKQLPEDFMLGYLYYYETLAGITQGLGTPTAPALILDEYTYYADGSAGYDYTNRTAGHLSGIYKAGKPGVLLPGFYPRTYTADNQKSVIEAITDITYNDTYRVDGFWIYSLGIAEIAGDKQTVTDYVTSLAAVKPKNSD